MRMPKTGQRLTADLDSLGLGRIERFFPEPDFLQLMP